MSYGTGTRRARSLSHIMEYHIPDSDLDDSDEETSHREPRNEQNHRTHAERHVRFAQRDAFRTEPGPNGKFVVSKAGTIATETTASNNFEVYRRAAPRNNATLELDAIRARTDSRSPLGAAYDGRHDMTTLHIFLWGCLFGIMIASAIFTAWINGAQYADRHD
ncbi:hypothetical protein BKA70DRAFT_1225953 [Coprinopsis sp. MPI-PUGE-AT-0042]|nr:hypothetical protein BKA70DRAFT_1225953 [Coprinopsis sp. MPI-PUGE-AT-0042]